MSSVNWSRNKKVMVLINQFLFVLTVSSSSSVESSQVHKENLLPDTHTGSFHMHCSSYVAATLYVASSD